MASTSTATQYTTFRIPSSSPRLEELVEKFRHAKLAALEAEPTGFAVTHADEVLHPLTLWKQRLSPPSTILICVATPKIDSISTNAETDEDFLFTGEWVGMATIRGPLPYSTFHLPESGQPIPSDPDLETRWHLCNLYTSQPHRGQGLAKKLVNASIAAACEQTRALARGNEMKARIRLFCHPDKTFLVKMYKGLDFDEAGKCTLKEAFVANGDGDLVPQDTESTEEKWVKWEKRYGLAMERLVDA